MGLGGVFRLSMMFSAIDGLTGPVGKMLETVQKLETVGSKGKALVELGNRVSDGGRRVSDAAATMRGGIAAVVSPVMEVEDSLAELSTVWTPAAGSMADAMQRARGEARAWSDEHKATSAEFIRTAYQMGSAGLQEEQAIAGTKAALTLATAALGDNVEAANLLAVVYNTLGDKSAKAEVEMGRIGDVLARTQQLYQIANLGQLNAGLQYAIPVAQQARLSIEQTNAAIGALNSAGLQGSMAGTAFASAVGRMATASEDLEFQLVRTADGGMDLERTLMAIRDKYGPLSRASTEVQEQFKKAFGDEGVRAIGLLTENLDGFRSGIRELENAEGAAAKGAAAIESTGSASFQKMRNQVQNLTADVGQELLPIITDLVPVAKDVLGVVRDFVKEHPGLVRLAGGAVLVAAGVGTVVGPVMNVIGWFIKLSGWGLSAVASIGRGAAALKKSFEMGGTLRKLGTKLADLGTGGKGSLKKLADAAKAAGSKFWTLGTRVVQAGLAFVMTPFGAIITAVAAIVGLVGWAIADWEGFKEFWVGLWDSVVGAVRDAWEWIKGIVGDIKDAVSSVTDVVNFLPGNQLKGPADEGARSLVRQYFAGETVAAQPVTAAPVAPAPVTVKSRGVQAAANTTTPAAGGAVAPPVTRVPAQVDLAGLEALKRLGGSSLNLPVGFNVPDVSAPGGDEEGGAALSLAQLSLFQIPDRRGEGGVAEQGPSVTINGVHIQSGPPLDERRIVQLMEERLGEAMRAQGANG